jgi:hypothetical protein
VAGEGRRRAAHHRLLGGVLEDLHATEDLEVELPGTLVRRSPSTSTIEWLVRIGDELPRFGVKSGRKPLGS